jgi:hypothetical protein
LEHVVKAPVRYSLAVQKAYARAKTEYADALMRTLVVLPYIGTCECGLMLTERDRDRGKKTVTCPRCGKAGRVKAVEKVKGLQKTS